MTIPFKYRRHSNHGFFELHFNLWWVGVGAFLLLPTESVTVVDLRTMAGLVTMAKLRTRFSALDSGGGGFCLWTVVVAEPSILGTMLNCTSTLLGPCSNRL